MEIGQLKCECERGPRALTVGEGTVFCSKCQTEVKLTESINRDIAMSAMDLQAKVSELEHDLNNSRMGGDLCSEVVKAQRRVLNHLTKVLTLISEGGYTDPGEVRGMAKNALEGVCGYTGADTHPSE